jgi:hypothetical protein
VDIDWAAALGSLLGRRTAPPPTDYADPLKDFMPRPMVMARPDVIGNRPGVQEAVRGAVESAAEPFGLLGKTMMGRSETPLQDLATAAIGMMGPPGAKAALKPAAEAAEELAGAGLKGITAYHGSPHDFERFDMSKIGTGEGAQAYGHGLYFAENEGVAKDYKNNVKDMALINRNNARMTQLAKDMEANSYGYRNFKDKELGARQSEEYDRLMEEKMKPGKMYQVAIKADPEHFLDWDKPLSEQSPKTVEALKQAMGKKWDEFKNADASTAVRQGFIAFNHETVAKNLREAGIPGIKYFDQGSRVDPVKAKAELDEAKSALTMVEKQPAGPDRDQRLAQLRDWHDKAAKQHAYAQNPTRNYVVFDDKLIDILKKYGIAGIGALPAMGAYHFQHTQDQ